MDMPERSFGRTVRYRRTKLGLSQAKLAELVGRTTPTIRSWERDRSRPNDPKVVSALAAVLGIDERHLFDKAGVDPPATETSPTVEQALATLSIPVGDDDFTGTDRGEGNDGGEAESWSSHRKEHALSSVSTHRMFEVEEVDRDGRHESTDPDRVSAGNGGNEPAYVAPPDPYDQTPLTPTIADVSYIEDSSQRQLYRVRTLATLVAVVVLAIAFIWAIGEGWGALDAWWNDFFGNLRL